MIRFRRLRLIGTSRNYGVSFLDDNGGPQALSVIAGQISTGKSAILEFIDYCLGNSHHPRHVEIQRQVQAALLELELSGDVHVIERRLFSEDQNAWVHRCDLDHLEDPHHKALAVLTPAGAPDSLSTLLLEHAGLDRILLKEAPTQTSSRTDPLSFRDLMWLCFLPNSRMDNRQLLQEHHYVRELKLRQVIEVVFGVHDQQLTTLSDRLRLLEDERRDQQKEIDSVTIFLREDEVPDRLTLEGQLTEANGRETRVRERLSWLSAKMQAETTFAQNLRASYARLRRESDTLAARVRDRDTLLRRLLPLRGQYAEDESKLVFFAEAQQLFDPLRVKVCPSCLQELPTPARIADDGSCSLCRQKLPSGDETIDVEAERAAIRLRLRAIDAYIAEVEEQLRAARRDQESAAEQESHAQVQLDSDLATTLAPFVEERDSLVHEREAAAGGRRDIERQVRWLDGLDRRKLDLLRLDERIHGLRQQIKDLQAHRPSRDGVVSDLSGRFRLILEEFGFPKLDDPEPPFIDDRFVPHVRGNRYSDIGSTGAMTLIALAWQLAIFEAAVEEGRSHPGFLLIDSPQKNLTPQEGEVVDEFSDPAIVQRVWDHLSSWSSGPGSQAQVIVVDNAPPASVEAAVVVRYSGRDDQPPYGLIDNETA
jgi:hypothetical protein